MESKIALMRKVLVGLLEEVEDIEEEIKAKGIVPREICELCKETDKRNIVDFSPKERKNLEQFKEWLTEMKVIAISQSRTGQIFLKTTNKLEGIKSDHKNDKGYVYALPDTHDTRSKRYKILSKISGFLSKYDKIKTCRHFDEHPDNIMKIESHTKGPIGYGELDYVPENLVSGTITKHDLSLCCNDCRTLIENTMCDRVRKSGFLYKHECPVKDVVLRKRLLQNGLTYEELEKEDETNEHGFTSLLWRSYIYYLRQNSIIISRAEGHRPTVRSLEDLINVAKYLNPELIVAFDDHSNLPLYLELGANILFYDQDGLSFYDKDRQPEEDIAKICEKIVTNLNAYVEKERGREHDRVVSALYCIGGELGYVPQKEYGKSGVRIDCVWFDREGKIQVALEVETTATWKKDLISTWEVEPKLAIIIGFPKTDKAAQNLMQASLMKYTPHSVLYINKQTDHAFLFDKQKIVKYYNLEQEEEDSKSSTVRTL